MFRADRHDLTPRESAVLAAVSRRLTNTEIASEFFVSRRTVETHIASLRRKLGATSRAELIAAGRDVRSDARDSFVGRESELESLGRLLGRERLVTLSGPAGVGKSRLALETAALDGRALFVVDLERAEPEHLPPLIGRSLGLDVATELDLLSAIEFAIGSRPSLLIADNVDRVADEAARLAARLIGSAAELSVVLTGRTATDGVVFDVAPLSEPAATRLLGDRIRSAAGDERADAADPATVASIGERVDRLPLALELAASRVRQLSVAELDARLALGFSLLDRAAPDSRHRTLDTAFAWTWDLLEPDEQRALIALAALPAYFDLDLAEAVLGERGGGLVLRLVDHSLLLVESDEPRRFRVLHSLRAFVAGQPGEGDALALHARYVGDRVESLSRTARFDDSPAAVRSSVRLTSDAVAALDWAARNDAALAVRIAHDLAVLAEQYGARTDVIAAIDRAARQPGVRELATSADLVAIGVTLCFADLELVAQLAAESLDRAKSADERMFAHELAGFADAYRGRAGAAFEHLDVTVTLAVETGSVWDEAAAHQARGIALRMRGASEDSEPAIAEFGIAARGYARAGDAMHANNARYMMASMAVASGVRLADAKRWTTDCIDYARQTGNDHELAHALLTRSALLAGPSAEATLQEALGIFRSVGDLRCLTRCHLGLADFGGPERAGHLREALALARTAHDPVSEATIVARLEADAASAVR